MEKRLHYCQVTLPNTLGNCVQVAFGDEKWFTGCTPKTVRIMDDQSNSPSRFISKDAHMPQVMFFCVIAQTGENLAVHLTGKTTSISIIKVLENKVFPWCTKQTPPIVKLVLDNAPVHKSKLVQAYLFEQKSGVEVVFLPPKSPDLNPIESVFANVSQTLSQMGDVKFDHCKLKLLMPVYFHEAATKYSAKLYTKMFSNAAQIIKHNGGNHFVE